jgi:hypothetical protein
MRIKLIQVAICLHLLLPLNSAIAQELLLESAYLINGVHSLEPSGLAECQGKLLFVSDKHDEKIFELLLSENNTATAQGYLDLGFIPTPPPQNFSRWLKVKRFITELIGISGGYDWEGITCNDTGDFYLASEYYFSVLKVGADGSNQWIGKNIYQQANKLGFFIEDNAYIEGITLTSNSEIILAIEREPRGIISILSDDDTIKTKVQSEKILADDGLPLDLTGLESNAGKIFALERNRYRVCELTEAYTERQCYSFKDIAKSPQWGYSSDKYGSAEGLAIDKNFIWVLQDNNGNTRRSDQNDNRATLFKFVKPF